MLRLSVASTLFPHLPHRSRAPFRMALALLFSALVAFALLRWQAPLIAVGAVGLPLIIGLYLYQADVHRDLPIRSLVLTAVLGIALGVGWALLSGALVADSYDVTLGSGDSDPRTFLRGVAIPVGSAVLMLVPVVVIRLLRPVARESLDGFVFGVLGAISFVAAATLTRLAPQFETGVDGRRSAHQPAARAGRNPGHCAAVHGGRGRGPGRPGTVVRAKVLPRSGSACGPCHFRRVRLDGGRAVVGRRAPRPLHACCGVRPARLEDRPADRAASMKPTIRRTRTVMCCARIASTS